MLKGGNHKQATFFGLGLFRHLEFRQDILAQTFRLRGRFGMYNFWLAFGHYGIVDILALGHFGMRTFWHHRHFGMETLWHLDILTFKEFLALVVPAQGHYRTVPKHCIFEPTSIYWLKNFHFIVVAFIWNDHLYECPGQSAAGRLHRLFLAL